MGDASQIQPSNSNNRPKNEPIRFGPFELDLRACELRKNGRKIKIYGQPLAVLGTLIDRPGELVTREELQQKLWSSDTFVDFEHGLNAAINKLREALSDNADNPRYIETLPRRGYRFIGEIVTPVAAAVTEPRKEEQVSLSANAHWKLWAVLAVGTAIGLLLVATWLWSRSSERLPKVLSYRQLTTDGRLKGPPPCQLWSRMVTDGPRLFFSEQSATVAQVSATGGEVSKIATQFSCFAIADISPDKTELLGSSPTNNTSLDQPLWSLSVATGQAHRLGNLIGHAAAWAHDGQRIAFATGSDASQPTDVFAASKDGDNVRKLARFDKGAVITVRWSPQDSVLRMIVVNQSVCNPWEVSADGTNLHPLTITPEHEVCEAYWTSDGRYSVLVVGRQGSGGPDIWVVRSRSGFLGQTVKPVQLTDGAMGFINTTISPDGKHLYGIGGQTRGELIRYDPNSQRLEQYLSGIAAEHLDFSRDGKWLAYVTFPGGVLWKRRVDGKERTQLTTPPLFATFPKWSPDGKTLAFTGQLPAGLVKIYVVSAEGGKPQLVSEGQDHHVNPSWVDGNSLIFGESQWAKNPRIFSLDLRTRKVSSISGSEGLYSPVSSPDGRFIVAQDTPGNHRFLLFDRKTQKWSLLLDIRIYGALGIGWPQWSRDGRHVYGSVVRSGTHAFSLYKVSVADHRVERVTKFEIPGGTIGAWGPWVGLTPDGSPLMLRDLSSQDVYAMDVDLP